MPKISELPALASLTATDVILVVDTETGTTSKMTVPNLIQAIIDNIVDGGIPVSKLELSDFKVPVLPPDGRYVSISGRDDGGDPVLNQDFTT